MPHGVAISLAASHVILERLSNLEHTLDMLHTEDSLLS
jgi:hypothetical protein